MSFLAGVMYLEGDYFVLVVPEQIGVKADVMLTDVQPPLQQDPFPQSAYKLVAHILRRTTEWSRQGLLGPNSCTSLSPCHPALPPNLGLIRLSIAWVAEHPSV